MEGVGNSTVLRRPHTLQPSPWIARKWLLNLSYFACLHRCLSIICSICRICWLEGNEKLSLIHYNFSILSQTAIRSMAKKLQWNFEKIWNCINNETALTCLKEWFPNSINGKEEIKHAIRVLYNNSTLPNFLRWMWKWNRPTEANNIDEKLVNQPITVFQYLTWHHKKTVTYTPRQVWHDPCPHGTKHGNKTLERHTNSRVSQDY